MFFFAILDSIAKWLAGSSSNGGMHIRPVTLSFKSKMQWAINSSALLGPMPDFWSSKPVLICIKNYGMYLKIIKN